MNKKSLVMIILIGILGLAAGIVFAWFNKPQLAAATEPNTISREPNASPGITDTLKSGAYISPDINNAAFRKAMTEKQLKLLVQSMRAKMLEVDQKQEDLAVKSQQIEAAKELLQKDVNELTSLKVELSAAAAAVKQQRDMLEKARLQINGEEIANLKKTAGIYDKMDSTSAGKIFMKMGQTEQLDDAVKILNYMTERTAAKLLAELGTADPNLAAGLSEKLKTIKEVK